MNTTLIRRAIVPGIAALLAATTLAACGSSNDSTDGASGLTGTIAAGGSSAQEKAQEAWRAGFGANNADATITYDPVGSGTGRDNFYNGSYAFAGSDSAISADDMAKAKEGCKGADPIEVPVFISPIDIAFNVPGVESLNLDGATLGKIFAGDIAKWNDPAIAAQNAGVDLPDLAVTPVHRSDSSGTTDNFTDYLFQASGGTWKTEHSSDWPVQTGEAAEGTSGVIGALQDGEGTIGYADDSAVASTKLGKVSVKVGDTYVAPSAEGAAAGLAASTLADGNADTQLVYTLNRTPDDASIYPVFMASYLLACPSYADKATADLVKGFAKYIVSEGGQKAAAANALSAPLPADIATKAATILDGIIAK